MPYNNMPEQNNTQSLGLFFRQKREEKGLLIRQVAAVTELDQAIISRIENGDRIPTKDQVMKLAGLYNLDTREIMSAWLAEKMVRDYGAEPYVTDAFKEAHERIMISNKFISGSFESFAKLSGSTPGTPAPNKNANRKSGRKTGKSDK
jgi:HTH-type transcriptional regulator, competence development regulator